jgi:hypothetical protein
MDHPAGASSVQRTMTVSPWANMTPKKMTLNGLSTDVAHPAAWLHAAQPARRRRGESRRAADAASYYSRPRAW